MSGHTPGPWRACHDGKCPCAQIWCRDYPVAQATRGEWGDGLSVRAAIVEIWQRLRGHGLTGFFAYGSVGPEMAGANARLLAAAPELLEALAALTDEVCDYATINNLGDPEAKHNVRLARAAIAKAEGRS